STAPHLHWRAKPWQRKSGGQGSQWDKLQVLNSRQVELRISAATLRTTCRENPELWWRFPFHVRSKRIQNRTHSNLHCGPKMLAQVFGVNRHSCRRLRKTRPVLPPTARAQSAGEPCFSFCCTVGGGSRVRCVPG